MPLSARLLICLVVCFIIMIPVCALAQDTTLKISKEPPKHSTTRAAVYSAVLPGLGQAYNKKYWKIPIIYAGFGAFSYFVISNHNEFKLFKDAYIYNANGETYETDNPYVNKYTPAQLQDAMEYYRRNRDLSIILGALWYTLNILEAYVDAHFFDYDISEDISLHMSPAAVSLSATAFQPTPGIKVSFNF